MSGLRDIKNPVLRVSFFYNAQEANEFLWKLPLDMVYSVTPLYFKGEGVAVTHYVEKDLFTPDKYRGEKC